MLTRVKTFVATGLATAGRLYAGDLNAIQDAAAAQSDYAQRVDALTFGIGESGLALTRYGAGEARLTGAMRMDAIVRALGGIYAGQFTTAARNAIASGFRPYGLVIWNTDTSTLEKNIGTDASPNWQPVGGVKVQNNGGTVLQESGLNFIPGSGITFTITDNPGANRVDVTIAAPPAGVAGTVPIGGIIEYAGTSDPTNYLLCDGRSLLRTSPYDQLFSQIGTAFGSVDGTHFNIPDIRGRVVVGPNTALAYGSNEGIANANIRNISHFHNIGYDVGADDSVIAGAHIAPGHSPSGSYIPLFTTGNGSNADKPAYIVLNRAIRYQ